MNVRTLVLGDSNTGKTMFIRHSHEDVHKNVYIPTIGVDYSRYTHNDCTLRIWDTAGHKRFKQVVENFYANNMLVIFVYKDKASFASIELLRRDIQTRTKNCKYVLIYNGKDKYDERDGEVYGIMYNMAFFPCKVTDVVQSAWTWKRICEYCRLEREQGWVVRTNSIVSNNSWRYCWWF